MSTTVHETTIRQWVKNHTKSEIAWLFEDQIVKRDAEIERLTKALDQAIALANIRLEYRNEHGDPEGDTHTYVCCDSCGTPFMSILADELERRNRE